MTDRVRELCSGERKKLAEVVHILLRNINRHNSLDLIDPPLSLTHAPRHTRTRAHTRRGAPSANCASLTATP